VNLCRSCGQDFTSVRGFDKHRVGVHLYTYSEGLKLAPPREDGRRCLAVDELEDAGFRQTASGRWELAEQADRARRRFGRTSSEAL
jgi:hypothetical protein